MHTTCAQYWSVPLYLQDLLHECGLRYTSHADNFDRLVSKLLELDRVVFVTLNYDTIFDRVLAKYHPLDTLDDYVSSEKVALIKLHGSVNWAGLDYTGVEQPAIDGYQPVCHLLAKNPERLGTDVVFLRSAPGPPDGDELRRPGGGIFYPALAAPLGPDDEPVCPPSHVEALTQTLDQRAHGPDLHVLILGYSCLDKTPLELIKQSGSRVASAVIVNGSSAAGQDALSQVQNYLTSAAPSPELRDDFVDVFDGGFRDFAKPQYLANLVQRIRSTVNAASRRH